MKKTIKIKGKKKVVLKDKVLVSRKDLVVEAEKLHGLADMELLDSGDRLYVVERNEPKQAWMTHFRKLSKTKVTRRTYLECVKIDGSFLAQDEKFFIDDKHDFYLVKNYNTKKTVVEVD